MKINIVKTIIQLLNNIVRVEDNIIHPRNNSGYDHHEHDEHGHHKKPTGNFPPPVTKPKQGLLIEVQGFKTQIYGDIKMAFQLKDSETTVIRAVATDAGGAVIASAVLTWATSDDTILTVAPASDTKSAVVTTTGKTGDVKVTVTSGAVTAEFDITVTAGEVAAITLTADAPTSRITPVAPAVEAPVVTAPDAPAPVAAPVVDTPAAPTQSANI